MNKLLLALLAALTLSFNAFAAVNLNTATLSELESLNNIGPVKAQAIIDYRKKNGGFKKLEDLNSVPGIGDKTMESLKGDISLSGATTVAATAKKADAPAKDMKKETKKETPAKADKAAAKPAVAAEAKVDAKPADTAKADKKAAADAKKAEKDAAKADKKAAADKAKADKKAAADEKKAAKKAAADAKKAADTKK